MHILLFFLCIIGGSINAMNVQVQPLRLLALQELFRQKATYSDDFNCIIVDVVREHYEELNEDMQVEYYRFLSVQEQNRIKESKKQKTIRDNNRIPTKGLVARNIAHINFFEKIDQREKAVNQALQAAKMRKK